jgi:hypothetical protein
MTSAYLFQIQSALIFTIMCFGIMNRKTRSRHIPLMATVMIWDILLVLQIELTRGAVLKASHALTNPAILNIHVALAVSCVVLYGFQIFSGKKLLLNDLKIKNLHRNLGMTVFVLRFLTLVTSFFAVKPQ